MADSFYVGTRMGLIRFISAPTPHPPTALVGGLQTRASRTTIALRAKAWHIRGSLLTTGFRFRPIAIGPAIAA